MKEAPISHFPDLKPQTLTVLAVLLISRVKILILDLILTAQTHTHLDMKVKVLKHFYFEAKRGLFYY